MATGPLLVRELGAERQHVSPRYLVKPDVAESWKQVLVDDPAHALDVAVSPGHGGLGKPGLGEFSKRGHLVCGPGNREVDVAKLPDPGRGGEVVGVFEGPEQDFGLHPGDQPLQLSAVLWRVRHAGAFVASYAAVPEVDDRMAIAQGHGRH